MLLHTEIYVCVFVVCAGWSEKVCSKSGSGERDMREKGPAAVRADYMKFEEMSTMTTMDGLNSLFILFSCFMCVCADRRKGKPYDYIDTVYVVYSM